MVKMRQPPRGYSFLSRVAKPPRSSRAYIARSASSIQSSCSYCVITVNAGSMRASNGCSRRIRSAKPWIVEMYEASVARRSAVSPASSKRRIARSFISLAAFRVKVMARTRSGPKRGSRAILTKRSTSTVVLPAPAPAVTASSRSRSSEAISRCVSGSAFIGNPSDAEGPDPTHRTQVAPAAVVFARLRPHLSGCDSRDLAAKGRLPLEHESLELVRLEYAHATPDVGRKEVAGEVAPHHSVALTAADAEVDRADRLDAEQRAAPRSRSGAGSRPSPPTPRRSARPFHSCSRSRRRSASHRARSRPPDRSTRAACCAKSVFRPEAEWPFRREATMGRVRLAPYRTTARRTRRGCGS